jgi:hypothetical protein
MTTMTVKTFLTVAPLLPASTSILMRGDHGIGKSQLGRLLRSMIATNEGIKDFELIDRRLSQVSEGDIIGLPSTNGEVTRFNPPDWYKRACDNPCYLFLDELNRATPEVMQAAFQIVLDRELNGWKLHPQTRVLSAINASSAYNVNEVDPALLDRFWVIDLKPDEQDWLDWGRTENESKQNRSNCISVITDFIAENKKWLDPPVNAEPGKVHVSRRSWERLSDALVASKLDESTEDPRFYAMSLGFIGTEASIAFVAFAKSQDDRFTGKDIIENYKKVKNKVMSRRRNETLNLAIDKVSEYITTLNKVTDKQGKNLEEFMKDLPGELRISLWTKITSSGVDKIELAKSVHKYMAKHVLDVFQVPMGDAGIGVVPNIPGIFAEKDAKDAKK